MADNLPTRDDLALAQEREQRIKDMLLMRKMDICPRHEVKDVIKELNLRFKQYSVSIGSDDFRILQTIQDFNRYLMVAQSRKRGAKSKVNYEKPVAMLKGVPIYAEPKNAPNVFTKKE